MSYLGVAKKAEIVVSSKAHGSSIKAKYNGGTCFFNPSEFSISRDVTYAEHKVPGLGRPITQFVAGGAEIMQFSLLFDTYAAGAETRNLKQAGVAKLPSMVKTDVREYTDPIIKMMEVSSDLHSPPVVSFKWGDILFDGYMISASVKYTMFNSFGTPVRAVMEISLRSNTQDSAVRNSPDRTKHKIVTEGDRLYMYSYEEYGQCTQWRLIAEANGIDNPRVLQSGSSIVIPPILT